MDDDLKLFICVMALAVSVFVNLLQFVAIFSDTDHAATYCLNHERYWVDNYDKTIVTITKDKDCEQD